MNGREQIEQSLSTIFADHETGRYVAEVRAERTVSDSVSMLAAVTGLVPAGASDVNPELNAIQTLVAKYERGNRRSGQARCAAGVPQELRPKVTEYADRSPLDRSRREP